MDIIAVGSQTTGFFLWPLLHPEKQMNNLVIPITVFCISCGYWENYTTKHTLFGKLYTLQIHFNVNEFDDSTYYNNVFWIFRIYEVCISYQRPNEENTLFYIHVDVYLEDVMFLMFYVSGYVF